MISFLDFLVIYFIFGFFVRIALSNNNKITSRLHLEVVLVWPYYLKYL